MLTGDPLPQLATFELLRSFSSRERTARPDCYCPYFLRITEGAVCRPDDRVSIAAGIEHQYCLDTFGRAARDGRSDNRGFSHPRLQVQRALDIFGKHVQPLRRDDHFLLASADVQLP